MTRDEATALGIESSNAQEVFRLLGYENMATDPAKRLAQIERFERARTDMHAAMNRHIAALSQVGVSGDSTSAR